MERRLRELANNYGFAEHYSRKVATILCHLKIFNINTNSKINDRLSEIIKLLISDCVIKPQLLTLDSRITLLYNCLKILLGVKQLSKHQ